jgi:hypothetical protein
MISVKVFDIGSESSVMLMETAFRGSQEVKNVVA